MSEEQFKKRIAELERELEESRLHEKALGNLLEKKLNEIYVHYHISRTIGSSLDLQDLLRQVTAIIRKSLPLERISVYLADESRGTIELVFHEGYDSPGKIVLPVGEGTPGRVVENGEHVHLHDLALFYETFNDFIHYPGEAKRGGSYIGITLRAHNSTIGMIGMDNPVRFGLSVDDMDFMAIVSHQLAAGIEKSLLFSKIQQLSQYDGLTGLFNRRMFEENLLHEINRRGRSEKPLTLMMLDIDHFKQFNDTYGHQAGDTVLRQLAKIIAHQTRCNTIDICCRYGGEEFAVIMPELELSKAAMVAERLRKAVEEATVLVVDKELGCRVTVSIGVSCVSGDQYKAPDELVKQADDALYRSKKEGRNRVSY